MQYIARLTVAKNGERSRGQASLLLRRLGLHPAPVDFLKGHDMGFRLGALPGPPSTFPLLVSGYFSFRICML